MTSIRRLLMLAVPLLLTTSCISYAVGTTARPAPKGDFQPNLMVYTVPGGIEEVGAEDDVDDASLAYASADFEGRWGLTDRSDLALRVPAASGAILTYKRMFGPNDPARPAFAGIVGGGIVNFGNHAYVEAGLIGSGIEDGGVPYGGIRTMHVMPIASGAVEDSPTVGIFGGYRMRINESLSLSPELGIYYDEPALQLRERNIIFIPSISFHWN
ncbi:MAG TPA: hypothetical protein VE010_00695 [Thermoanaerobaculia bacterium]|nr:hypothetical protein [Thermoanaerobaculia bacterium]